MSEPEKFCRKCGDGFDIESDVGPDCPECHMCYSCAGPDCKTCNGDGYDPEGA
jgi:hypothetical protein